MKENKPVKEAPKGTKKLVVLDGMSYAFRSFYAVPEMTDTKGQATNAVFGFANALRRAERQFKPLAAVVAFDSPGGSFRDEMLKEYKGHRDAPPEALVSQFPLIEELAACMGWRLLKKQRFEADDVMATLVRLGRKAGYEVVLMTTDKDMLQLIGEGVRVYRENPKGASLYGPEEVKERFGVGPEGIADLLGLMGDSSDNIPGVPGVGEKTAAKLLIEYGTLPKVLAAAPGIKGKLGENLREFAEQARLSRRLVELRSDVELGAGMKDLVFAGPDFKSLLPFLKRMELRSLLADYTQRAEAAGKTPDAEAEQPAAVEGMAQGAAAKAGAKTPGAKNAGPKVAPLKKLSAKPSAASLRQVGLDCAKPCGVALAPEPVVGEACPRRLLLAQAGAAVLLEVASWEALREALACLDAPVLFHSKTLQRCLLAEGLPPLEGLLDISLAAWLVNSVRESRDLAEAAGLLGVEAVLPAAQAGLFEASDEDLRMTAAASTAVGLALRARFKAEGMADLYDKLEGPLVAVLAGMENDGVKVDVAVLEGLDQAAQKEMQSLRAKAVKAAGRDFNLNSPSQLADVLFKDLGLEAQRKTKTGYSTDNEVLEALAEEHELPGLILEHRQLAKLSGTYLQALPRLVAADGRVHSTWNQNATATGRLSSTDPNLQNIPVRSELGREIRKAFVASKRGDLILAADYSQIELRVLAHYCGDPLLKKAFLTGRDIHTETAARMHHVDPSKVTSEMRSRAKVINFGVLYGMGAFRISREFGTSVKEAKAFLEEYFGQFPTVRDFLETCKEETRVKGYASTLLGRRRPIPEINSANRVMREHGERIATNLPIQGTAADLIKIAMLEVDRLLKKKKARTRLLMQVHDELVFELAKEEADSLPPLIQKAMEGAMKLDVPLVVETGYGRNWDDAKG
ncbi:MAG TPA: DNA polymerase I [bacterium]|jgi:DNA polymerase-1|nr:DNA polymerase I [bacterium]